MKEKMKNVNFKNVAKYLFASFAMAQTLSAVAPEIMVHAAAVTTSVVETRYIVGDGVRLRQQGWTGGTVLELMYDGETIRFFPEIYGSDTEYNYMQRVCTSTYGYVNHDYTRL